MSNPNTVLVVDLGISNIASVVNMLRLCGAPICVLNAPSAEAKFKKIILPGVGSFDSGMNALNKLGWKDFLNDEIYIKETPILGICLGMQLMANSSEEGDLPGLGWIDAEVRKFKMPVGQKIKVPHMGWNTIKVMGEGGLFDNTPDERFYFVHSFHVECNHIQDVMSYTTHGYRFPSSIKRAAIYGVQFHPEKSHKFGLSLLNKFIRL